MNKSSRKKKQAKKTRRPDLEQNHNERRDEKHADQQQSSCSLKTNGWMLATILLGVGVCLLYFWFKPLSTEQLTDQIQADYQNGLHVLVIESAEELERRGDASNQVLLTAADSAEKIRAFDRAIDFLSAAASRDQAVAAKAYLRCGEMSFDMGNARDSERFLRQALKLEPASARANHRLAYLLNVLGRRYESSTYAFEALKGNRLDLEQLILFTNRTPGMQLGDAINLFLRNPQAGAAPLLADARTLVEEEKPDQAIPLLEQIVGADFDVAGENVEAYVFLGRAWWAKANRKQFSEWYRNVSQSVEQHPDYWETIGDWAYSHQLPAVAARAYWQSLKLDPDCSLPNYRLGELLAKDLSGRRGSSEIASQFKARSKTLTDLHKRIGNIMKYRASISAEVHEQDFRVAVEHLESLDRIWEAYRWSEQFLRIAPDSKWANEKIEQFKGKVGSNVPRYAARNFPADRIDLSNFPQLEFPESSSNEAETPEESQIRFSEVASSAGVDFTYFNAPTETDRSVYMYQLMGASVGVIDFDLDGLPDLYFPQGCRWPIDRQQNEFYDKLFRNSGSGEFKEVASKAEVQQNGFGCGIAVGDFDCDGFPDIYVANLGENRLLQNNGDGSFVDVSDKVGFELDQWTCSTAIADLNNDGLPDIFDVNYLAGPDVFTKTCGSDEIVMISCPPRDFEAAQDRLWINQGDGQFRETSKESGVPPGKGLGLVVGNLDDDGNIDVFISNDGDANHLLINDTSGTQAAGDSHLPPKFSEQAAAMGADLNSKGDAQACMGIAVLDINRDRKIDLFVTNFSEDYNIMYLSNELGYFDGSRQANLTVPGFDLVGFGTQALDAELDGDEDLLVTNGGVQDYKTTEKAADKPFEMPALFLENNDNKRFEERGSDTIGDYFSRPQVGRGMARLDWNRDGLEEVAIGNMGLPAALLRNDSNPASRFVSIKLIGTRSSRDAIGTSVEVISNNESTFRQLTAGDGYAASNQRELVFAIPGSKADLIRIHWSSGLEQSFRNIVANEHYIAVEGKETLFLTN